MAVDDIARRLGWEVVEKCTGGEFGAHLVERDEQRAILKLPTDASRVDVMRARADLVDRVISRGQRAPRYLDVGTIDDRTYTLQECVDGEVPAVLQLLHAQRMIDLLETHARAAVGVTDPPRPFVPTWDPYAVLRGAGGAVAAVSDEIRATITAIDGTLPPADDVVHNDYHHQNVMVRGDEVVAIIDWDAPQVGDRYRDAFLLMWWSQITIASCDPAIGPWLRGYVEARLDDRHLALYAAETALRNLDFFQRAHPEAVAWIHEGVERTMAPYWRSI